MSYGQFIVSDHNPNDTAGGGGCACDPRKQEDCHGPYIVCFGNDMEDALSPHVVIGCSCVDRMHAMLHEGEALSAGEDNVVPDSPDASPTPESQHRESPVVESPDPEHDFDIDDLPLI